MAKSVKNFAGTDPNMPDERLYLGVEVEVGALLGVDANDNFILATNVSSGIVRAVAVATRASTYAWDASFDFNGRDVLEVNDSVEMRKEATITDIPNTEIDFTSVVRGQQVYLGLDGKPTVTIPTGSGTLVQKIGVIGDPSMAEVIIRLYDGGEIL